MFDPFDPELASGDHLDYLASKVGLKRATEPEPEADAAFRSRVIAEKARLDQESAARAVRERLRTLWEGGVAQRTCATLADLQGLLGTATAREALALLAVGQNVGWLTYRLDRGGLTAGRPSVVIRFNPEIHEEKGGSK